MNPPLPPQLAGGVSSMQPGAQAPKVRVEWVDYAKGICIFFVVMFHVNDVVQERAHEVGWLDHVVTFARPFRMPDFFLIAGLFLANAMRRPWRRYLDSKVLHFFYFYVLWMTLQFVIRDLKFLLHGDDGALGVVGAYFLRWIEPVGPLWFIHMLPVFFLVTRLTRRVPPWAIWLIAAGLHSLQIKSDWHIIREFASRYVYFYSGYVLAPHVFRIAAWGHDRAWRAVSYLALWGAVNGLLVAEGWAWLPGVSLALGYAGALAVIFTAVLLSKARWTEPLRYLGQNSIVVYLADVLVSMVVVIGLSRLIPDIGTRALISTIVTALATIVLWRVTLLTPARFMYVRPRWLRLNTEVGAAPTGINPSSTQADG